jgi:enterochelin esterase-like enzyme
MNISFTLLIIILSLNFSSLAAKGTLTDNIRIDSKILGYTLQYRVYEPEQAKQKKELASIYLTDGQGYLRNGKLDKVLDREIESGNIYPVIAIFVDSRDPDKLSNNRRNSQLLCNTDYAKFYMEELIPTIETNFNVKIDREHRAIAGLSFGGLNAACFGLVASQSFGNIGMHSPANTHYLKLLSKLYKESELLPLKMFMSVGTKKDNTKAARKFHRTLKEKGYDVNYIEVPFGHEWRNWRPLMDDLLLAFFKIK